ncbi:TadE/TadG family type IV pilus assembly protein [Prosthecomicrobium sp. N25]|uniref:TadE/TadG family type IV pilus assembly protein n=1 Tax=Prosthecomicrobium sp. N25 TaxID=3129254 RepID=UPI003078864D
MRDLKQSESGNVSLIVCGLIFVFAVLVGGSLDFARLSTAKVRTADALDRAVLAASKLTDADGQQKLFKTLMTDFASEAADAMAVKDYRLTSRNGALDGTAKVQVRTAFLPLVGLQTLDTVVDNSVSLSSPGLEVALVLDVTSSMIEEGRMEPMRSAALSFVDSLVKGETGATYMALVPFDTRVNIGPTRTSWLDSDPGSFSGCVEPKEGAAATSDTPPPLVKFIASDTRPEAAKLKKYCPKPVVPLTNRRTLLIDSIKALTSQGTTRIDQGAFWGWMSLSEKWQGQWGTASLPHKKSDAIPKLMVIMTDGQMNTRDKGNPDSSGAWFDEINKAEAKKILNEICDKMRADGITIYAINYDEETKKDPPLKTCAGNPDNSYYSAKKDIDEVFAQIAKRIQRTYLSR